MEIAALYHRPESEYAYLYKENRLTIRLRTKRNDVKSVDLLSGDTFLLYTDHWYEDGQTMKLIASTDVHDYWEIETTINTKRLAYGFHVKGMDGTEVFYNDRGHYPLEERYLKEVNYYFRMPYFQEADRIKTPEWVKETVWYQIFPERFKNGDPTNDPLNVLPWGSKEHPGQDDFYGGDLQGIIHKLDYLKDLGINGLYLTPIFEAKTNHKYDTTDYKKIDEMFGDTDTLKILVEEAHKRGMRIMLDAVFNHIGYHSKQWQDVLRHQEKSKYKDWFYIHSFPVDSYNELTISEMNNMGHLDYDTFGFVGHMPKLNTSNPEVKAHLLDVATYWIREFDIDGWRLDVANEVDHQFWKAFYRACVNEKEDFYIIGEIWHSSRKWLEGDEFHAVMNYVYTEKIEDFFIKKELSSSELVEGLNQQLMLYPKQVNEVQFNILDSHDTPRILSKAKNNKKLVQSILAFMFGQQGTPCIYYGTEIGLDGFNDPDCRKCMIWDEKRQDQEMLSFMKKLIAFRKKYQPFMSFGDLKWLVYPEKNEFIGFSYTLNDEKLTFYFNESEKTTRIKDQKGMPAVFSKRAEITGEHIMLEQHGFVVINELVTF